MTTEQPDSIREGVRQYLAGHLGRQVPDDENIFAVGLVNSLFAVQLVTDVERQFGVVVETDELDLRNFCSVDAITAYLAGKTASAVG